MTRAIVQGLLAGGLILLLLYGYRYAAQPHYPAAPSVFYPHHYHPAVHPIRQILRRYGH